MQRMLIAGWVAVLAGCAVTPAELRRDGVKSEFTTRAAPREAANCSAKGIENAGTIWTGAHIPSVRDGDQPGSMQLAIPGLLVADFLPTSNGSNVTTWEAAHVIESLRRRYIDVIRGC